MGKNNTHVTDLPIEIQERILAYLDGESLESASSVTFLWKEISKGLWRQLCIIPHNFPVSNPSLPPGKKGSPSFRLIDCKPNSNMESWLTRHNYSGIYDMVLNGSKLVVSVYNTIQVLDLDGNILNVLSEETLNGDGGKTFCYYSNSDFILCGTETGNVQVFDALSGNVLGVYRRDGYSISDIRIKDELVLTVDTFGAFKEWILIGSQLKFKKELNFEGISPSYTEYNRERLLDTDGRIVATSVDSSLYIARIQSDDSVLKNVWVFSKMDSILCIVVFGSRSSVAVGTRKGLVFIYIPSLDSSHYFKVGSYQTPFKDSITSICAYGNSRLVFGDVNAEIHCCKLREDNDGNVVFDQDSNVFTLESGHLYGSYVWAVKMDATRIYSGDSNSNLSKQYFDDSNFPEWTKSNIGITVPLMFPEQKISPFGVDKKSACIFCEEKFIVFVVGDVNLIADIPAYVGYWKGKFCTPNGLKDHAFQMKAPVTGPDGKTKIQKNFFFP
ncbi:unnamed protein product [Lepeophtheirus salmonis]|uniref:(salmon louse) hypothetical protein n=1 Tax=Lepeophtheirus salmonis TaxID=72036 RepID=A0A7R8D2Z3_LEPSM|nr:unnamed protein product [Lepeophtheirus salmonis]CAF2978874.1 unnamed protein product [Lepeophtheirus salmonis]